MNFSSNRREFLKRAGLGAALLTLGRSPWAEASAATRPLNILLITADDMGWFSPGCFGAPLAPELTPNLDRLAAEGVRFDKAHVTIAVCQPSRSVLHTGRYPHRNGAEGFQDVRPEVPTLGERLHAAGYLNGILGKVGHTTPLEKCKWDYIRDERELGAGRNPAIYRQFAKEFLDRAKAENKPFFLMANSHDPHRPFYGGLGDERTQGAAAKPSRIYKPEEVRVPAFLPDLPEVRREMAEYCSSARRCDDTVGAILKALEASGQAQNTLVMFLSDNGISMPFAKSNCYLNSTRTPWIVRWPGKVQPGGVDQTHMISGIDFMPTVLAAAGLAAPAGMDGRSFLPLLQGQKQDGRDMVFTQYHETSAKRRFPMRCVQDGKYGYIFNFWADGKNEYQAECMAGRTFKAMSEAAAGDPKVGARVGFNLLRGREEFYDLQKDPDALCNLIDDPAVRAEVEKFRQRLETWMAETGDPALEAFRNRDKPEALAAFMAAQDALAKNRREAKAARKAGQAVDPAATSKTRDKRRGEKRKRKTVAD